MTTVPSTTIITNLKNATPPTANTLADADGGGLDMPGMLALALTKAYELKVCLTKIVQFTDSTDPNLPTLNDILASLT
jgi:hypothetical protein